MILAKFFDHAVTGWGREYPRSKYEMGVSAFGALVAVVFEQYAALFWLGIVSAIAWLGFYTWACIVSFRLDVRQGDLDYDRRGKYKLSKEYWDTESASTKGKKAKSKR